MRGLILGWLVVAVLVAGGCGAESTPQAKEKAPAKPEVKKAAAKPPQPAAPPARVPDDAYPDVPTAITAMAQAALKEDNQGSQRAEQWLVQQGSAALPKVAEIVKNESAPLEERIVCSGMISRLPGAKQPLLEATSVANERIRLRVIEALGRVEPSDPEIVAALIKLTEDPSPKIQSATLRAIRNIGPAAKDAGPALQKILDSQTHDDYVRDEARATLKVIDERRGLMGLNKGESR